MPTCSRAQLLPTGTARAPSLKVVNNSSSLLNLWSRSWLRWTRRTAMRSKLTQAHRVSIAFVFLSFALNYFFLTMLCRVTSVWTLLSAVGGPWRSPRRAAPFSNSRPRTGWIASSTQRCMLRSIFRLQPLARQFSTSSLAFKMARSAETASFRWVQGRSET